MSGVAGAQPHSVSPVSRKFGLRVAGSKCVPYPVIRDARQRSRTRALWDALSATVVPYPVGLPSVGERDYRVGSGRPGTRIKISTDRRGPRPTRFSKEPARVAFDLRRREE